jgi:hypothetical protein
MHIYKFVTVMIGSFPCPIVVVVEPKFVEGVQINSLILIKKAGDCCQL